MMKISVLGAGAWGTALAMAFAHKHQVTLWTRHDTHALAMQSTRQNEAYLPKLMFPEALSISADFAACLTADLVIVATPMNGLRPTLQRIISLTQRDVPLLWACKGVEQETACLPHQIVAEVCPHWTQYGVLSGPSFALEVAKQQATAVVVASKNTLFANEMARALHTGSLRVYANHDLVGVEIGGAVKNVLAIATGICDGLELGMNARAALMTRGLAEMMRLATTLGGDSQTLLGLSGVGDLILTCTGALSRNRQVGLKLAQGLSLAEILNSLGHVAEGVSAAKSVSLLAQKHHVEMPITFAICALLAGEISAQAVVHQLLERAPTQEF
jgi:glycerol-3-phosphate dehydrogenase (NAD(P)+)